MFKLKNIKLFVASLIVLFNLAALFLAIPASAFTCYKDPDYKDAGSSNYAIAAECPNTKSYVISGTSTDPTILYALKSGTGTPQTVATLTLKDATTNPLVWEGYASYDPTHKIVITVPRDGLSRDPSGFSAIRTDFNSAGTLLATSGVRVAANTILQEFAEKNGITVASGSADLEATCTDPNPDKHNCGIIGYLVKFINVLSASVGILIVAIITFRGVQYTFARDDPQIAAKAKDGIRDAILALVYFLFIFAFLQWVVPGGLF